MNRSVYTVLFVIILIGIFGTNACANIEDTLYVLGQKRLTTGEIVVGYSQETDSENIQAVRPYSEQKSFPTLDLESFWLRDLTHLRLDSQVKGQKDYIAELHYEYAAKFRVTLLEESLLHRLDHQPVTLSNSISPPIITVDSDQAAEYDLQFRQQDISLRYSPDFLASHVSLRYHRTLKNGDQQLRYLDENCTTKCHIYSRTRPVDLSTQELTLMADAHLGVIEVSVDHLQRTFDNESSVLTDTFNGSSAQHDHLPGNRYNLTTLKIHNSLAGGIVAAGSVSAGKRQNNTEQTDVAPIEAETSIYKAAGELTWIPSPLLLVSFRYRIMQIDNEVASQYSLPSIDLPEAMDLAKSTYGATISVSPNRRLTLKGDYQHEQIHRSHVSAGTFWELPKIENIDRLSLDMNFRPFIRSSSRLDLGYLLIRSSDPAYAMSNEVSHVVKANARLNPSSSRWGGNASLRIESGENGGVTAPFTSGQIVFDRKSRKSDATVNGWFMPYNRLTLGASFGFSHLLIKQDLFYGNYGNAADVIAPDVEARQIVRNSAVNANLVLTRTVSCSADLHHIRGGYHYSPGFPDLVTGALTLTPEGLGDIGSLEVRQNGLSAGINWQMRERLSLGLRYLYDSYRDAKDDRLDSTVQSYQFTLAKTW